MPKIYTEEEKYQQKIKMYTAGLKMISQNGYKNVKVDDLVEVAGVSKGYFYLLFESKEEFILDALMWQMGNVFSALKWADNASASSQETGFLYQSMFKNLNFIQYSDITYIKKKCTQQMWDKFKHFEEQYFKNILKLLGKDDDKHDPRVISNLSSVIFLSYNSMKDEESSFFTDKANDVTQLLWETLHRYLHE